MLSHIENSKQKGLIGFTTALQFYTRSGYTVLTPLIDSNKYDFVVEKDGIFQRVQVKTSTVLTEHKYVCYSVVLESRGGSRSKVTNTAYKSGDFDLLFVLVNDGRMWSIPATAITSTVTLCVGTLKFAEYEVK